MSTETERKVDRAEKVPTMEQAILTAIMPLLQPTGEHRLLPDRYCPDCQGQCLREWLAASPALSTEETL